MSSIQDPLGRVTQALPSGGEDRPGQRAMAESVTRAIDEGSTALIEAGTGTGKSLAYLTPVIAAGKRAIVATATIALQDQLVSNDVPLVADGLGADTTVALLKGRSNYLCKQRLVEFERASSQEQLELLRGSSPGLELAAVKTWAESTETGDKEELDPAPSFDVWRAVSVGADECPGASRCPSGAECFAERARSAAAEADVIVTNHHYYGLDLSSGGVLLPEHDAVIFDEAHHLPEVLAATCGTEIGGGRLRSFARRVRSTLTDDELPALLDRSAIDLDNLLRTGVGEGVELDADLVSALVSARDRVDKVLGALKKIETKDGTDAAAKIERATVTATGLVNDVDGIIGASETDVLWIDGSDSNPVLRRTPLDVTDILEAHLWGERAVVLTSATLPDGLGIQLGLDEATPIERVGSPFDYPELGLLYCATHLPEPRMSNAREAVRNEMVDLINAAGGRTLGLFTSASAMREAAEDLRERLDMPVLMQGDSSKQHLIEEFKASPETVLLATMSFWQGVDLPGDTLTLVTIDRLPFPRPDEPVTQARRDQAGRFAFKLVDLPRAQMLLAQAAGRLVRRTTDRGVVAVLDSRLANKKSYRWDLINALPPLRRTKDRDEVLDFLRTLDAEAKQTGEHSA